MSLRRAMASLLALLRKQRLDRELENEIRAHLELAERDALARGLSPEDARREARRSFGGIEQMKEEHRDRRSFRWIETVLRDLRYGLASLLRAPGFTAVVVGVLALGIGANVAMFSVVDAVLLKPLPFPEPDRIVRRLGSSPPGRCQCHHRSRSFSPGSAWLHVFDALAAEQPILAALSEKARRHDCRARRSRPNISRCSRRALELGRTFTSEEDRPGAAPVDRPQPCRLANLFRRRSRHLAPARRSWTASPIKIIGVLQPGAFDRDQTQFWKPLVFTPDQLVKRDALAHRLRASPGGRDANPGPRANAGDPRRARRDCSPMKIAKEPSWSSLFAACLWEPICSGRFRWLSAPSFSSF